MFDLSILHLWNADGVIFSLTYADSSSHTFSRLPISALQQVLLPEIL